MQAIVLAAGKGERIKDITQTLPKPMIKIGGKPILEHNLEWLKSYGIEEVYINLHHLPKVITDYFGDGNKAGIKINYSFEPVLLGTAGAVAKIANEYSLDENFLVIYADNLLQYNLGAIINFHLKKHGIASIAVYEKEDIGQSGIVVLDSENRVTDFIEKPSPEEVTSHLVNTGIYVLSKKVLKYIPSDQNLDFGKNIFPTLLKTNERMYGLVVQGKLVAVDTPELLRIVLKNVTT